MNKAFSSMLVLAGFAVIGQAAPEVRFPTRNLPPPQGTYITPSQFHALYANGIIISNISHRRFTQSVPPPPAVGGSQVHTFGSTLDVDVKLTAASPVARVMASANCSVRVTRGPNVGTMEVYDTEMLSLDLVGLPGGARIRESPTLPSRGQTTIRLATDGSGSFMIMSFFDIFTEISTDNGANWSPLAPGSGPAHVEVRLDPTTVPPVTVPSSLLPPPNDVYISPALFHLLYTNGIVIRDIRHRFFTGSRPPPPPGGTQVHEFGSQLDYQLSTDGGATFRHGRSPASTAALVRHRGTDGAMQIYDTEMLSLNISGGDLPPGVIIRESPTLPSPGGTTSERLANGTYRIGSFFDVFTEVTLNGGQTWSPAREPARVVLECDAPESPFPDPNLPPPTGRYLSATRYSGRYVVGAAAPFVVLVTNIVHRQFTSSQPPPPPGGAQTHQFGSEVQMDVSMNGGTTWNQVVAPASVAVSLRSLADADGARFFDTEMLSLNIAGGGLPAGVRIRESPTRPSLGRTSMRQVTDGTGGIWDYISSFFDVFTELSVDNGQTWTPSTVGPKHVVVTNTPVIPPITITCPPDMTVFTPNAAGTPVNYPPAIAAGGCDAVPTINCAPPSGSNFPIGTTTVNCVASDSCGSPRATCQFKITVVRRVIEIDKMPYGLAQLTLALPTGNEVVQLAGSSTVHVFFEGDAEGDASDDDGDGRDEVQTQMMEMDLRGNSSAGAVQVTLDPNRQSFGEIEEGGNFAPGRLDLPPFSALGTADSFFDIFPIIRVGGQVYHTAGPLRVQATIRHKPPAPGDTYINPFTQPVPLLDANNRDTGIRVIREVHTPNPEKEIDDMPFGTAQVTLTLPNGGTETVTLAGPTKVVVCIPPNGAAADTDGDGLEQVPTEMVSMDLRGHSSLGPVRATLDPARQSLGEIEETANTTPGILNVAPFAPGTANSFFDISAVLTLGDLVLRPAGPIRMQGLIRHKPPGPDDEYVNPFTQPVPLLDANGRDTGIRIVREVHTPNPPKERDFFSYSVGKINVQRGTPGGTPSGPIERVIVGGPTTVEVCIDDRPGPNRGRAADLDGDGLDEVPTEMTQLMLSGNSSIGPVQITLDPASPTLGGIEEKVNGTPGVLDLDPFGNRGCANSYFDVRAIIRVAGRAYCPAVPLHIEAMICHKPPGPGESYMNLINQPPVELIDCATGQRTGIFLTGEMHTPNPPKEVDYFSYSQGKINIQRGQPGGTPSGPIERVIVAGPTRVEVGINDADGLAADTDGDGLDQVPTLMTLLNLAGNSSMGPVTVSLNPAAPTTGEIEEKINGTVGVLDVDPFGNRGCANSYFDVRPIIKIGGLTLCPRVPLHIEAMICHKPPRPGEAYMNLVNQPPIELVDCASGQPTGIFIVGEMHTPNIPKEVDYFSYSQGKINIQRGPPGGTPSGAIERVIVAGPTRVDVGINDADGLAADTDGDGLDDVQTEMTLLNLMGNSSLGPVMISLDPNNPTYGGIEEKVNGTIGVLDVDPFGNRGCANSFFDVRPIIKIGNLILCPRVPLHIEAMICHKPPRPGEAYMNLVNQPPIELVDCATGQGTGIFIVGEMHTPNIPKEVDYFSYSQGKINIRHPDGRIERVIVAGPTQVDVGINDDDGLAADTDGDGLDDVQTQMTLLNLMGNSSLGPVMISLDPNNPTYGGIEEKVNGTIGVLDVDPFGNRGCGNSFFDVRPIIKVGARRFCPALPLHIEAMICHKPPRPGEAYMNLVNQEILLLDCDTGQPTGYVLTGEMHSPNPQKEIDVFPNTTAQVTVQLPTGGTEIINLSGPTRVVVCIEPDGLAADTDADGRDQVPTEMVQLSLTGNSSLGPAQVQLNPARRSLGEIEETANATPGVLDIPPFTAAGTGDSFFDIFIEMRIGTMVLHNEAPIRMASLIRHKPPAPGDTYINPFTQPVPLLDANGNDTGIRIIREVHTPNVPCTNTIICPSNVVVWTCSSNTVVTYPAPIATSSCNLPLTITCVPPSGSTFPVGNTPVTCTARDTAGSVVTCTFNVRVIRDTTPPVITCPSNILVQTCREREQVVYVRPTATDDCDTNVTVTCDPPSGTVFPIGVHVVTCRALDDCGNGSSCTFRIEVRRIDAIPRLTVTPLPNGRIRICWTSTGCTGWVLQCATDLNPPIQWRTVTNPPSVTGGLNCVILPATGTIQVYRLSKQDAQTPEVYAETDTFPPQGVYEAGDEVIPIPVPGLPRPILTRWFRHPIPPPEIFPPRPPPCLTCPPERYDFRTELRFQFSQDDGMTWVDVAGMSDVSVQVMADPPDPDMPDVRSFDTEMLQLNLTAGLGTPGDAGGAGLAPQSLRIRESPTRRSTGQTTLRRVPDGTFMIDSFFDVFLDASVDGGQTWIPIPSAIRVTLGSKPPEQYAATDTFPPRGTYNTPRAQVSRYANGIRTRWYLHPLPPDLPVPIPIPIPNPPCLTCPPLDFRFTTEMMFQVSVNDGPWMDIAAMSDVSVRVRQSRALGDTRIFEMEMDKLNVQPQPEPPIGDAAAAGLPPGVMLRESPSRPSKGRTSVRKLPDGTYRIGSFFDIFTELSVDGGQTWSPVLEPSHVEYIASSPRQYAATDTLPAPGSYDSPAEQITQFDTGILARWYRHPIPPILCPPFCPRPGPCLTCPPDPFEFDTEILFQVSNDGGRSWADAQALSHVKGEIKPRAGVGGLGTFDTEMLSLEVRGTLMTPGGEVPFMLRESPTRRSLGYTEVAKHADGTHRIGSFFDIFTEMSMDGGQTWHPSKEATHVGHSVSPPEQYEATGAFPPPGSYNSPAPEVTQFDNGILTRWYLHQVGPFPPGGCPLCPPPPCLTCPPIDYRFAGDIRFQVSSDGGRSWMDVMAKTDQRVRVKQTMALDGTQFFDVEMLSLDLVGGAGAGLPGGVRLRESPTRRSLGKATWRQVPGMTAAEPSGYRIGSFFDVFTELSLDGGQRWASVRKPSHVILTAQPAPVPEATATFPPAGSYNSPPVEITRFPNGILARRYRHIIRIPPIIPRPWPCLTCPVEIFEFPAPLFFEFSVNGGQVWQQGQAQSLVQVMVDQTMMPGGALMFDSEMVRLDALIPIPGTPGVRIRESPTRASLGVTMVTDSASLSQPFNVGSFFDIFTELSVDGGATWAPSEEPTHVELQPQ